MFKRHLCAILFLGMTSVSIAADVSRPNVIVVLADDMGLADYSAYGTKDVSTPAIDRIAKEGMTFSNFRANSCVCSPTRAALLTGCYPDRVGVPGVIRHTLDNSWGWLSPDAILLPQVLKTRGYHSAIVGKWHLGLESPNSPNERGFDHFHGFLGDMMDDYFHHRRGGHNFMRLNQETIDPPGHATDLFTTWACDYINDRSKSDEPFFLYLAYNAPHDPIQPTDEWLAKVRKREPNMSAARAGLVAMIEQMDDGIGQVLKTLDEVKLADNTLIFFTSDNGGILGKGANNGPWRSEKQHMYEGGLRVPAVARWPGKIAPNQKTEKLAVTMDLFATIAQLSGAKFDHPIDAMSFLPTLLGTESTTNRTSDAERELYFVRREGGTGYGGKTIEALIKGDWKVVQDSPFGPIELYNLKDDPNESLNRINQEKAKADSLTALLRKQIQAGGKVAWQPK